MNAKLYQKLTNWRSETARAEGIEAYRVISTQAIEGIAEGEPQTKEELLEVKGIAEKKLAKYGKEILQMVADELDEGGEVSGKEVEGGVFPQESSPDSDPKEKILSVGDFLDLLNIGLRRSRAKVSGEVSSVSIRSRYLFFTLKDEKDGALLNVFMWRNNYDLSGVALEEGMAVAVSGYPEVYKPSGRFTFQAQIVEPLGEGALKRAYDELKKKLEAEGVFAEERKKEIPDYPHTIGVITSRTGAVIHDFLNNLGKHGYHVRFYDSRVEGQMATRDLLSGVQYFKKNNDIDVLVVMRGGGSLESLQAFNNEKLVRSISGLPFPVIAGIGHDKDVALLSLAADKMVSTPTAVTSVLNESWKQAASVVTLSEQKILAGFRSGLQEGSTLLGKRSEQISSAVGEILENMRHVERRFMRCLEHFGSVLLERRHELVSQSRTLQSEGAQCLRRNKESLLHQEERLRVHVSKQPIEDSRRRIKEYEDRIRKNYHQSMVRSAERLRQIQETLHARSPKRQLELGYSISFRGGKVLRDVEDLSQGDDIEVRVLGGSVSAGVKEINPYGESSSKK